jgi:hypothetical protein
MSHALARDRVAASGHDRKIDAACPHLVERVGRAITVFH